MKGKIKIVVVGETDSNEGNCSLSTVVVGVLVKLISVVLHEHLVLVEIVGVEHSLVLTVSIRIVDTKLTDVI